MIIIKPPQDITPSPFVLDDVVFVPDTKYRMETAIRCCRKLGDVLLDDSRYWFARKAEPIAGDLGDWQPMRCAAEARAFLVSKIRQ